MHSLSHKTLLLLLIVVVMMKCLTLIFALLLLNIDEAKPAESNLSTLERESSRDKSRLAPTVLIINHKDNDGATKFCHGTLVHSRMVLTHAGCFKDQRDYEVYYLPSGDPGKSFKSVGIDEIYSYQDQENALPRVIMLFRLSKAISIERHLIPRLPAATEQLPAAGVFIVGYGALELKRSRSLQELKNFKATYAVKMSVLSNEMCAEHLDAFNADTMMCLAPEGSQGSPSLGQSVIGPSDVGLGLLVKSPTNLTEETSFLGLRTLKPPVYTIHAIISNSFNYDVLDIDYPIYLTKLAAYSDWIKRIIKSYAHKSTIKSSFMCGRM